MTITTRLSTYFNGKLVGSDVSGNKYYCEKKPRNRSHERRWVIFASSSLLAEFFGGGKRDSSVVTPDWHGWLHHATDTPPNQQHRAHYGWEKPPLPNLTGTMGAYLPQGHLQKQAQPAPTMNTYEPWKP